MLIPNWGYEKKLRFHHYKSSLKSIYSKGKYLYTQRLYLPPFYLTIHFLEIDVKESIFLKKARKEIEKEEILKTLLQNLG